MDALALLCTLHADGPTTLQRLKSAGCSTLADLGQLEEERLIELIESTPAAARRFRREARHLAERVGADWLEREEGSEDAAAVTRPEAEPMSTPAPAASRLPPQERSILEKVLAQWREADAREPVQASAEEEPMSVESLVLESLESDPPVTANPLVSGSVDGLDENIVAALANCGIDSLEAFETAPLDQLALQSGIGYSRLDRIRRLMHRAGLLPVAAPVVPEPQDLLVPRPPSALPRVATRWEPAQEGAAGPFA